MPPIAQRLREPAAFVLLAYGAISTLFNTITFLFGPGESDTSTFSSRAAGSVHVLLSPVVIGAVVGSVVLAHLGTQLKLAKVISLTALVTVGVAALFGVVALFSAFGSDYSTGWGKTVTFFVGLGELGITGVAAWLLLGYFQQHGPIRPPANPYGQPPQQQWQQPQQQWQPPQTAAPAPQPWGPPPSGQQAPQGPPQQWGPPPPAAPQGGYTPAADSMATQAIPAVPPPAQQQPQAPQQAPQAPPETQPFPPVGNWTSEG